MLVHHENDVHEEIRRIVRIMGSSPHRWFKERGFDTMEAGNYRTLCSCLWTEGIGNGEIIGIRQRIELLPYYASGAYAETIIMLLDKGGLAKLSTKVWPLMLALGEDSVYGKKAWSGMGEKFFAPHGTKLPQFLNVWFPGYKKYGSPEEAAALFGMESGKFALLVDAWCTLMLLRPGKCRRFAMTYKRRYLSWRKPKDSEWKATFATLKFERSTEYR